jgi:hypothetical protein
MSLGGYDPNPEIMAGFGRREGEVRGNVAAGRAEAERQRAFGGQQAARIAPMAQGIYNPILADIARLGQGLQGANVPGGLNLGNEVGGLTTMANLARSGFEGQAPLLEAGFGELNAREQARLGEVERTGLGAIDQDRLGYLGGLDEQRRANQAAVDEFNARARTQAAEFGASARNTRANAAPSPGDVTERERFEYQKTQDAAAAAAKTPDEHEDDIALREYGQSVAPSKGAILLRRRPEEAAKIKGDRPYRALEEAFAKKFKGRRSKPPTHEEIAKFVQETTHGKPWDRSASIFLAEHQVPDETVGATFGLTRLGGAPGKPAPAPGKPAPAPGKPAPGKPKAADVAKKNRKIHELQGQYRAAKKPGDKARYLRALHELGADA